MGVKGSNSTLANTDTSGAVKLDAAPDAASRDDQGGKVKYPEGAGGQGQHPGAHGKGGYAGGPTSDKKEVESSSGGSSAGKKEVESSSGGSTSGKQEVESSSGGSLGGNKEAESSSGGSTSGKQEVEPSSGGSASGKQDATTSGSDSTSRTQDDSSSKGSSGIHQGDTAPSYAHANHPSSGKPKGKNLTEGFDDDDAGKNVSFNSDIGDENDPGRAAENKFLRENAQSGADAGGGPRQKGVSGNGQYDVLEDDQQL